MWDLIIDGESGKPAVPSDVQRILHDQRIDEEGPGTILKDFATLLSFVGDDGLKTTGKYYLLPQGRLNELNQRMSHPVAHALKRPQQRSFPHLHGLHMLLRASGLGIGVGTPPGGRLMIDEETLAAWHDLNPVERYFTLLESWLIEGSPEIIGEGRGGASVCFQSVTWVAQKLRHRRTVVSGERGGGPLYGTMESVTVALMELFGWLRLEYGRPQEGKGVRLAAVERLPFGDAMVAALTVSHFSGEWAPPYGDEAAEPGALKAVFEPYFPEWQRTFAQPEGEYREGTYTWRVSLGPVWRRIVAPAGATLDTLAMTILEAFEFDDDHLYCFEFRGRRGRKMRIACPHEEDAAAFTDEVTLGDLSLPEGGAMKFVFDYGDWWEFAVKLEEVGPSSPRRTRPKVTAKGGHAPAQYAMDEDGW